MLPDSALTGPMARWSAERMGFAPDPGFFESHVVWADALYLPASSVDTMREMRRGVCHALAAWGLALNEDERHFLPGLVARS